MNIAKVPHPHLLRPLPLMIFAQNEGPFLLMSLGEANKCM